MSDRRASLSRSTRETRIALELQLDGTGQADVRTGFGILDHLLQAFVLHSRIDLQLTCDGDRHVDDHHSVEDCGLTLGAAFDQALAQRTGIRRFGCGHAPLDEALARSVIDFSGRPWPEIHLGLQREMLGEVACENLTHFLQSFAMAARAAVHVDVLRGNNDHHRVEAAFKSLALAVREAIQRTGDAEVPSTKGTLV